MSPLKILVENQLQKKKANFDSKTGTQESYEADKLGTLIDEYEKKNFLIN